MLSLLFLLVFFAGAGAALLFTASAAPLVDSVSQLVEVVSHASVIRRRVFQLGYDRGTVDASNLDYSVGFDNGFIAGQEAQRLASMLPDDGQCPETLPLFEQVAA